MKSILFAGLLAIAGVNCRETSFIMPHDGGHVEHLRRVPDGWKDVGAPRADYKMRFRVALRSADTTILDRTIMEISSPSSPRYGQHLSRDGLKDLVKPRSESSVAVLNWLKRSGIDSRDIRNDGEWINFVAPVKRAEEMMATTLKTYRSETRRNVHKVRALSYSVPKEVRSHIDMIHPLTRFGQLAPERKQVLYTGDIITTPATNISCNDTITPACLSDLYNFKDYKVDPKGCVTIGVNGFLEQYARYADFATFTKTYAPYAVGSNFSFTLVAGR